MPVNPRRHQRHLKRIDERFLAEQPREALELAEGWCRDQPNAAVAWAVLLRCVTLCDGQEAAVVRNERELLREDLPRLARGFLCANRAWWLLEAEQVGAWKAGPPGCRETEVLRLAEEAFELAGPYRPLRGSVVLSSAALAVVRVLQGNTREARRLARRTGRTMRRKRVVRMGVETAAYYQAAMLAVEGMADAGEGRRDRARKRLEQARCLGASCDVIPGLELSLEVADAGGLAKYRRTTVPPR